VFESRPEVLAHNVETVPRIFKRIRPAFRYERSLDVLTAGPRLRPGHQVQPDPRHGRDPRAEVSQALRDLHDAGCELITITQYLRPSRGTTRSSAGSSPRSSSSSRTRPRDRLRRRDVRPAGALVVPRRAAVPALLLCTAVVFGIGLIFQMQWVVLPLGVALGVLAAIFIFGRRMQRSVYGQAEGQPGAAGWALDQMRGQWRITQGVAGTTQLDAVHRVIGRPGVMLVAEGAPHRTKNLLAQEKKRTARLIGTSRSTTSWSATTRARCRCASCRRTSPSCPATSPRSRWTSWRAG
jgi:hypothetical protein